MKTSQSLCKKVIIVGIIVLFTGASIVPHIAINTEVSDEDGLVAY